jgi:hypothetical protein
LLKQIRAVRLLSLRLNAGTIRVLE